MPRYKVQACDQPQISLTKLLEYQANINASAGNPKRTPLQLACQYMRAPRACNAVVRQLLAARAAVNKSEDGFSPLHLTIQNQSCTPDLIRILLESEADVAARVGEPPLGIVERALQLNTLSALRLGILGMPPNTLDRVAAEAHLALSSVTGKQLHSGLSSKFEMVGLCAESAADHPPLAVAGVRVTEPSLQAPQDVTSTSRLEQEPSDVYAPSGCSEGAGPRVQTVPPIAMQPNLQVQKNTAMPSTPGSCCCSLGASPAVSKSAPVSRPSTAVQPNLQVQKNTAMPSTPGSCCCSLGASPTVSKSASVSRPSTAVQPNLQVQQNAAMPSTPGSCCCSLGALPAASKSVPRSRPPPRAMQPNPEVQQNAPVLLSARPSSRGSDVSRPKSVQSPTSSQTARASWPSVGLCEQWPPHAGCSAGYYHTIPPAANLAATPRSLDAQNQSLYTYGAPGYRYAQVWMLVDESGNLVAPVRDERLRFQP